LSCARGTSSSSSESLSSAEFTSFFAAPFGVLGSFFTFGSISRCLEATLLADIVRLSKIQTHKKAAEETDMAGFCVHCGGGGAGGPRSSPQTIPPGDPGTACVPVTSPRSPAGAAQSPVPCVLALPRPASGQRYQLSTAKLLPVAIDKNIVVLKSSSRHGAVRKDR
jgi:hypothetical protein